MAEAERWLMCRIGFLETFRAITIDAGLPAAERLRDEWPAFEVIEVDAELVDRAAALTPESGLRSLDALHLAAALEAPSDGLTVATWDRRLHRAALDHGLRVLPQTLA